MTFAVGKTIKWLRSKTKGSRSKTTALLSALDVSGLDNNIAILGSGCIINKMLDVQSSFT
jgi:hypothetical protein